MTICLVFIATISYSQILTPVKWSFESKAVNENTFDLLFTAKMDPHWHIYSTTLSPDEGPVPTSFDFKLPAGVELVGKIKEPKPKKEYDKNFEMELLYFENKAVFTQRVKITSDVSKVSGELTYMVCDESKCLPPEYLDFSFDLKTEPVKADIKAENKTEEENEATEPTSTFGGTQPTAALASNSSEVYNPVSWEFGQKDLGNGEYEITMKASIEKGWHLYSQKLTRDDGPVATEFRYFNDAKEFELIGETEEKGELHTEFDPNFNMELAYFEKEVSFVQKVKATPGTNVIKGDVYFMVCDAEKCLPPETVEFEIEISKATVSESAPKKERTSYLKILLYSFLGGLAALLTPCVFPMIPMTVSFFTKQSKTRAEGIKKGVTYGASIVLIYVLCSVPFHLFDSVSPDIFNEMATNPILNLFFFGIFMIFAISFLGAFELTLPSSWVNKADANADKGGLIGIFFMALTLILVSFSCTGPALGLLLGSVLSTTGGAMYLTVGLLGFGLGLALPFGLFAAFPGWLNSLPSSGGWLNSVKVVFGFVELAFLSNADLVTQSGYLTREVFIAIWIAISMVLTLYLLGFIRLPHDSKIEKLSVGRTLFATLTFTFTLYLIPGLWGAPLKLIAGFPPPMFYSESPNGVGKSATMISAGGSTTHTSNASHSSCPHNLNCFHDYDEGMAYAKEVGLPVMLDFTGWACVNCRKMEEQVWAEAPVLQRMRENVVLVSLYVDEKSELPESEKYVSPTTGKKIKTIGNKWSDFQIKMYQSNTQPYYVILDHEGNQLIENASYDPDVDKFVDWLDRGFAKFKSGKK